MRMIILMKKIKSHNWAPRYAWTPYIPTTNPPLVSIDNLYDSFYVYNDAGGLAMFYYILASLSDNRWL
jgi:hypothetical protein